MFGRLRGLTRRLGYGRTQRIGIVNCGRISTVPGVCLDWDGIEFPKTLPSLLIFVFVQTLTAHRHLSSLASRISSLPFLLSANPIRHHCRSPYLEENIRQHRRNIRTLDTNSNQFVSLPSHPIDTIFESVYAHLPSTPSALRL